MKKNNYWQEREKNHALSKRQTDLERQREIERMYKQSIDNIENEIHRLYSRYGAVEGLSMQEAIKRIERADMDYLSRKAERYVKDKDFSPQANREMKLYNLSMQINRLEYLKELIRLEVIALYDLEQHYFISKLNEDALDEYIRQMAITGHHVPTNKLDIHSLVNQSFKGATFSERIWGIQQKQLINTLENELIRGVSQGVNPKELARNLRKVIESDVANSERLLRTESARVMTEVQKDMHIRNGYELYEYIAEPTACELCAELDGEIFIVKEMEIGINAPPIHPNCRCSTAAHYEDKK